MPAIQPVSARPQASSAAGTDWPVVVCAVTIGGPGAVATRVTRRSAVTGSMWTMLLERLYGSIDLVDT
jgi:hypothetical protein